MEHVPAAAVPSRLRRPARLLRLASDDRLVAFVRAGDDGAFEALYDRHHRAILGFCRHMLGSHEEAEDALQHTFLAAYRDLVGSGKPIELRPWLFAIARNRCLSLLRARREHVALEDAEPSTDGLTATVERREDLRELLADLADLPEDQRAALLLAEIGALDHAGIATALGCPREKVKALVFQARSSLAASRAARATSCEQIRMELATASGAALRRGPLRRHLRTCAGCRAFKTEVAAQRQALALVLPVVPGIALKAGVLSAIAGSHGGGSATAAAGAAAASASAVGATAATTSGGGAALGGVLSLASAGAVKVAVSVTLAGAIAGGGALTLEARHDDGPPSSPAAAAPEAPGDVAAPAGLLATARLVPPLVPGSESGTPPVAGTAPPRDASARGFVPSRATGRGNGAAARDFARSRGNRQGLEGGTHPPSRRGTAAPRGPRQRVAPLPKERSAGRVSPVRGPRESGGSAERGTAPAPKPRTPEAGTAPAPPAAPVPEESEPAPVEPPAGSTTSAAEAPRISTTTTG